MRVLCTAFALILAMASSGAFAEDYETSSPELLQEAAIDAVESGDGDELLLVMTEMKRREMYFFHVRPDASCGREPPKEGLIGAWGTFGVAKSGYGSYLRLLAMENGTCACLSSQATFDEFLTVEFDTTAQDITETEIQLLITYANAHLGSVRENYSSFYALNCRAN